MKRVLMAVLLAGLCSPAWAASTTITIIVQSPASTSASCAPVASFSGSAPAGSAVCPIAVLPSDWNGSLTLSGPNASQFGIVGSNLVVGAAPLGQGSYSVTITAAP